MPGRRISLAAFTAGRRNAHRVEIIATTTSVSEIDTVNRGGFGLSLVMGLSPDGKPQRREPAATDVGFLTDWNG
jgi:hypothetical protein